MVKERTMQLWKSMMTSSNGSILRVTGPLCGEFTGPGEFPAQRPVTRSFDVFFDLRLNKRLSKQPWGWWFETSSGSLWCHCNALKDKDKWWRHDMEALFCISTAPSWGDRSSVISTYNGPVIQFWCVQKSSNIYVTENQNVFWVMINE